MFQQHRKLGKLEDFQFRKALNQIQRLEMIAEAWYDGLPRVVPYTPPWVRWNPPCPNEVILNTDGAVKHSTLASAGGLIRDSRGTWMGVPILICIDRKLQPREL